MTRTPDRGQFLQNRATVRVLVVEDSPRLCESLRLGLSREGFSVDTSSDGRAALSLARRNPFDLVVLDVMLPGMSGLEVLRELRSSDVSVPVLVLTARDSTEQVVEGFEAGADDYLVKPFAFEELLVRCRALMRRSYGRAQSAVQIGALMLDTSAHTATVEGARLELAARDYKVLEYLALRTGAVVRREELEDHVYRLTELPNSNAIDAAIYALRRKLGPCASYIRTVRGIGYVLEAPSEVPRDDDVSGGGSA